MKTKFEDFKDQEFLGDAVIRLCVIEHYIGKMHRNDINGLLTTEKLAEAAVVCGLKENGYDLTFGSRKKNKKLANAYEHKIAEIYLKGGMESAKVFFKKSFKIV